MHPFFLQEISHISTHLQESVRNSQTGSLLRLTAETFCLLELGLPFKLGDIPYSPYSNYITPSCWYSHLWKFFSAHPLEAHEDYPELQPLRMGEQFLIQLFVEAGYRGENLRQLNIMRMAIKAVTLLLILPLLMASV